MARQLRTLREEKDRIWQQKGFKRFTDITLVRSDTNTETYRIQYTEIIRDVRSQDYKTITVRKVPENRKEL